MFPIGVKKCSYGFLVLLQFWFCIRAPFKYYYSNLPPSLLSDFVNLSELLKGPQVKALLKFFSQLHFFFCFHEQYLFIVISRNILDRVSTYLSSGCCKLSLYRLFVPSIVVHGQHIGIIVICASRKVLARQDVNYTVNGLIYCIDV